MLTVLFFCLVCPLQWANGYDWPAVQPVNKEFHIQDISTAHVRFDVLGEHRQVLYQFECATADSASKLKLVDFDWSGDFECRLWSPDDPLTTTLLTYDPNADRDWMSRGKFIAEELLGACGRYPQYGKIRTFRLRGMRITLRVENIKTHPVSGYTNPLQSLTLKVTIRPDPSAKSTIEGQIAIREPRLLKEDERPQFDCDRVRYQHVPGRITQEYLDPQRPLAPYPVVSNTSAVVTFGIQDEQSVVIRDRSGRVAYRLQCASTPNIITTGAVAIQCQLRESGSKRDLLADTMDPVSREARSRIYLAQTIGACAKYPQWGSVRTFELRKMKITLKVENGEQVAQPTRVKVLVRVTPKDDAQNPIALPSPYLDPSFLPLDRKDACSIVYKQGR